MANGKILASVMGKTISEDDVNAFIASLGQRAQSYQNEEGRAIILNELINQKLLLLDANRNLYEADPAFKAKLNQVKENLLINFAVEKAVANVKVTDEEAKQYYDDNSSEFMQGSTVNASHILVDDEAKCNDIMAKIKSGEVSFEDAAKEYSKCPSAQKGGDLGDFAEGQMVPEFDEACFTMDVGELRGPVKTNFGYHIIRLNSKKDSSVIPYEKIKEQLKEKLIGDKQQKAYQSKINQLKILYQVDKF